MLPLAEPEVRARDRDLVEALAQRRVARRLAQRVERAGDVGGLLLEPARLRRVGALERGAPEVRVVDAVPRRVAELDRPDDCGRA